jgi:hypothetical protein
MTKRMLIAVFAVGLMAPLPATFAAATAAAQERTSTAPVPPPPPPAPPAAPGRPAPPDAPPPPPPPPAAVLPPKNVQLDIVITDTISGKPEAKRVTLVLRSGRNGSIRTQGHVLVSRTGPTFVGVPTEPQAFLTEVESPVELALDGNVTVLGPDHVDVNVTFNYAAPPQATPTSTSAPTPARVSENIAVVLRSGRALLASRSADPVTNRTVTVELTATIREP